MNNELKVSFYLKRESRLEKSNREDVVYPILGKISIGNSIAQFSSKLHVSELLWNVKSGRATGKSRVAIELNREINKINLSIHHHYKDILERTGKVTATDVKCEVYECKNQQTGNSNNRSRIYCPGKRGAWKSDWKAPADRRRAGYRTSSGVKRNENRKICNRNYQYQLLHCY